MPFKIASLAESASAVAKIFQEMKRLSPTTCPGESLAMEIGIEARGSSRLGEALATLDRVERNAAQEHGQLGRVEFHGGCVVIAAQHLEGA